MSTLKAKPFLKWAGGKTQLLNVIEKYMPESLSHSKSVYIEPFVGGGAVLFWVLNNFPRIKSAVINDINADLIDTYTTIAERPKELISVLQILQDEFYALENKPEDKKHYYYKKRSLFNAKILGKAEQAALLIFLNRTCFNGLYRVNSKNEFNVPIGSYKKPMICDVKNIMAVNEVLQKVDILCGDFEDTIQYADTPSFFYFDPPYKPLSDTSSFNSYTKDAFNDTQQIRLKNFCAKLDAIGHKWMLSNSDVKLINPEDNFFDDMYAGFKIARIKAKRSINSNPLKRGELNELLITNYNYEQALQTA